MNQLQAMTYAVAADNDARLAAYAAAMDQLKLAYDQVTMDAWWSARCQIALLAGDKIPQVAFGAEMPCGKHEKIRKVRNADDFTDFHYQPTIDAVDETMRRLALLRMGQAMPSADDQECLNL